jgi:hypothetical protein
VSVLLGEQTSRTKAAEARVDLEARSAGRHPSAVRRMIIVGAVIPQRRYDDPSR